MQWNFSNRYLDLPRIFYTPALPSPSPQPQWALFNEDLAEELHLGAKTPKDLALLSGNSHDYATTPLALAYAGHQFGHLALLGDGRAHLLGTHSTPQGNIVDVQLKGSGPSVYSRRGDGKATLGAMAREFIISESMHLLGVPSTRSLAVVSTGEEIWRDRVQAGAILTRLAKSHLRVGTFYLAASDQNPKTLQNLADTAISWHYPGCFETKNPYYTFLEMVMNAQAKLVAQWMGLGFIHGVMNTDNVSIAGESLDFGPCAFMNAHRVDTVFSSIDEHGRYAYGQQPAICQWNLARLAEALLPLLDQDSNHAMELAQDLVDGFPRRYSEHYSQIMAQKVGTKDMAIIQELLDWMEVSGADHTKTFRSLSSLVDLDDLGTVNPSLSGDPLFVAWHSRWKQNLSDNPQVLKASLNQVNPSIVPRNHWVERAIEELHANQDPGPTYQLLSMMKQSYVQDHSEFMGLPDTMEVKNYKTYCGT